MNLQKIAWRAYKVAARALAATRLVKLPMGNQTLGQGLRGMMLPLIRITLPNPVVAYGHKIYWDSSLYSFAMECSSENYEKDTVLLCQSLLHPGMTFVDLGAHIGHFSLLAAGWVGQTGKVYAFEPEPANYALFLRNIAANGYENIIKAVNKAVSNKEGMVPLYLDKKDRSVNNLFNTLSRGAEKIMVETTTLDNFFANEGWPAIHLIKIDIEGAEKATLEGMQQLVSRNQPLKLIIEFSPERQAAAGVSDDQFFNSLIELGFRKFWALRDGLQSIEIPSDVSRLVQMMRNGYVNIFCES